VELHDSGRIPGVKSGTVLVRLEECVVSPRSRRAAATMATVLLLAAQLIAAAHFHPDMLIRSVSDEAHLSSAEIACPVCVFHAHTVTSTIAAFMLIVPFLAQEFVATALRSRLLSTQRLQLFGRAPPASV
jgi:hypothetical protein